MKCELHNLNIKTFLKWCLSKCVKRSSAGRFESSFVLAEGSLAAVKGKFGFLFHSQFLICWFLWWQMIWTQFLTLNKMKTLLIKKARKLLQLNQWKVEQDVVIYRNICTRPYLPDQFLSSLSLILDWGAMKYNFFLNNPNNLTSSFRGPGPQKMNSTDFC